MPKQYDAAKVVISFRGVLLSGYADGDFCKVAFDEDAWTKTVGASGEVVRAKNNNRTGSIEVTLLQSSSSNDYLSAQYNIDELTGVGSGVLQVMDLYGTTLMVAEAWIKQVPEVTFGKEASQRAWMFDTAQIQFPIVGGNR